MRGSCTVLHATCAHPRNLGTTPVSYARDQWPRQRKELFGSKAGVSRGVDRQRAADAPGKASIEGIMERSDV